jgi:dTDP-4-dehydrorhamnose 3,5-epimerase
MRQANGPNATLPRQSMNGGSVKFAEVALPGAWIIDLDPHADERGYFARTFCRDEFAARGLPAAFVQCNTSFNLKRGTLRGMHFQHAPHGEAKLVRCTRGAVHDVIVDLRPASPAYCRWVAVELSADNGRALFIPEGVAHGFQTLVDASEVLYQMAAMFHPASAAGVRWDDPAFGIHWPLAEPILSARDATWGDFVPSAVK